MNTPDPDAADAYDELVTALGDIAFAIDAIEDGPLFDSMRRVRQAKDGIQKALRISERLR